VRPSRRFVWAVVASLSTLLFTFRAYAPGEEEYRPVLPEYGPISGSQTCWGFIGTSSYCSGSHEGGDGDYWGWVTQCWEGSSGWLCSAITDCPAGSSNPEVSCEGEYTAQADGAGVGCKDSGSDSWETSYCN
jgi:hypothetical protein